MIDFLEKNDFKLSGKYYNYIHMYYKYHNNNLCVIALETHIVNCAALTNIAPKIRSIHSMTHKDMLIIGFNDNHKYRHDEQIGGFWEVTHNEEYIKVGMFEKDVGVKLMQWMLSV